MPKNQKKSQPVRNGTDFSDLFQDIFGLQAWAEQKKTPNAHRSVPWQWVLWGGLLFFCLGFSLSTHSFWILIVAFAATVIAFLAHSTETVEPQVFLLTDNRTEEQKKAYRNQTQKKVQTRKRPARRPSSAKAEAQTQAKTLDAKPVAQAEEAADEKVTAAKPKRQPRKKSVAKTSTQKTASNTQEKKTTSVAKKETTDKPKAPRVRKPRTIGKTSRMSNVSKPEATPTPPEI